MFPLSLLPPHLTLIMFTPSNNLRFPVFDDNTRRENTNYSDAHPHALVAKSSSAQETASSTPH